MLRSIKSLTTELKAVRLKLVISNCLWMSCVSVPLVCARGKAVWRTRSGESVPRFPGWSEPRWVRGGAGRRRALRGTRGTEKPWGAAPGMPALSPPWPCPAGRCCTPRLARSRSARRRKWAYARELWNFLVVVAVTETSPVRLPINVCPCLCSRNTLRICPCWLRC